MFERLEQIEARFQDLSQQMADPEVLGDHEKYQKIAKQHRDLEPVVDKFREYRQVRTGIADARAMLAGEDPEIRAMAQDELTTLEAREPQIEEDLKLLLLPKDPNDEKNVVLEIRAGTGGDEASLFAAEIFRMYNRFAEQHRWRVRCCRRSESSVGGLKEVIADHRGKSRVFADEVRERCASRAAGSGNGDGRAASTPARSPWPCCPKPEDVDVKIEAKDLRIDTFLLIGSRRPVRQQPRTPPSGSRICRPTPWSAARTRSRRSRIARKGCRVLRARLYEMEMESSSRRWRKSASSRWAPATAARRFVPITSAEPAHGSSHRPDHPPAGGDHGGQAPTGDRRSDRTLHRRAADNGGEAEVCAGIGVHPSA